MAELVDFKSESNMLAAVTRLVTMALYSTAFTVWEWILYNSFRERVSQSSTSFWTEPMVKLAMSKQI